MTFPDVSLSSISWSFPLELPDMELLLPAKQIAISIQIKTQMVNR